MSDNQPVNNAQGDNLGPMPTSPPPGATTENPDYLGPDNSKPKKKGATAAIALGAAAAVLVGGGGVYAWTQFNGGGEQPYEKMVDGAMFYVQTNTNPSADQKLAINDLAKKFPEAKNEDGYSVLTADNVNGALLGAGLENDKEYDFVGDRMAIAAYPDSDDDKEAEFALIVQVTDEKKAEEAKKDIVAKGKEEDEPLNAEIRDGYLLVTTGDLKEIFPTDGDTLADNDNFVDDMKNVEDNAVSGWVGLADFAEAMEQEEADAYIEDEELTLEEGLVEPAALVEEASDYDVEGEVYFGLKVRDDGVDFEVYGDDVKTNGETLEMNGDQGKTADLLNSIAYDDALFNLGVTGLGDYVKQAVEAANVNVEEEGVSFTNDDLPGLLGTNAGLSVRYDGDEISAKLVLAGIDEQVLSDVLEEEGLSIEQAEQMLQEEFGEDAQITLEDGELVAIMGDDAEGKGDFESGTIVGSVDLDKAALLFESFDTMGEEPEDSPEGLGVISYRAEIKDGGDSKTVVGWTTPR